MTPEDTDSATEIGTAASLEDLGPAQLAIDGHVATITMQRADARNALNDALILAIDTALDRCEQNEQVRVVVLRGEGDHFSAGHDLTELNDPASPVHQLRATPEGKLQHEERMYWDRSVRLRDFPKPTVAAVQGAAVAGGLMLAACCDLIVASEDAWFSNPVLKMSGVGVELLVEPYELGTRRAKAFLFLGEKLPADDAQRIGFVHRVVPRDQLDAATREVADTIAEVPPLTAQAVKRSINEAADLAGQRSAWRYHFALHQFVSNTPTALDRAAERTGKGAKDITADRDA